MMNKPIPFVLLLAAASFATFDTYAQAWPSKPVRVIVTLPAGSGTDITGRAIAERLGAQTGQPFVVENRPGASGSIGQALVAKADPDGYTIMMASSSWTVIPATIANLPFDAVKDLAGITMLANIPNVLVMTPEKKINSVKELVAAAKAQPGKLNYATVGTGSATHLNAARFQLGAGIDVVQVPYKGTSEALTDLLGGRVDYCFCPVSNTLPLVKEGRLVALAVGSSHRSTGLPDTPTTEQAGVPNSAYNFWVGMGVHAKTPRDIVTKLHAETVKALNSPEIRERWARLGQDAQIFTPEQFDAYLREEMASNAVLVKAAGIKAN
ncbi:MAG: tripartite tricarboxylate transporter substrate binding protein [Betaproteobacteria bacterium]|nr:tripartite tricarboxylate transporter substrate binding protein [Betaproteobacteria bacterium]